LKVTLSQAGHAQDGSRFLIRNEIYRSDGKLAARITSAGGWLDLSNRRLIVPPEALLKAMQSISKTDDFQVLASSIK
jgi:acyl-CoA thioester hydrolase